MTLQDPLYGIVKPSPVIEALIHSGAFQRLKNIHQGGAVFLVSPSICHSRYEHSVGVWMLTRMLGASMEEQVMALLHDLSHTAFSHVSDYLFNNTEENYHESLFQQVVYNSGIPSILRRFDLDETILFRKNYTILEQELPALCADRVDYTLRDMYYAGIASRNEITDFVSQLVVSEGQIAVSSKEAARWISEKYRVLNEDYFRKPEHVFANVQMAALLRIAIQKKIIRHKDLMKDDAYILRLLTAHSDTRLLLNQIRTLNGFKDFMKQHTRDIFKKRELEPLVSQR